MEQLKQNHAMRSLSLHILEQSKSSNGGHGSRLGSQYVGSQRHIPEQFRMLALQGIHPIVFLRTPTTFRSNQKGHRNGPPDQIVVFAVGLLYVGRFCVSNDLRSIQRHKVWHRQYRSDCSAASTAFAWRTGRTRVAPDSAKSVSNHPYPTNRDTQFRSLFHHPSHSLLRFGWVYKQPAAASPQLVS